MRLSNIPAFTLKTEHTRLSAQIFGNPKSVIDFVCAVPQHDLLSRQCCNPANYCRSSFLQISDLGDCSHLKPAVGPIHTTRP